MPKVSLLLPLTLEMKSGCDKMVFKADFPLHRIFCLVGVYGL